MTTCPTNGIIARGCPSVVIANCQVDDYAKSSGNYDGIAVFADATLATAGTVRGCTVSAPTQRNYAANGSAFDCSTSDAGHDAVVSFRACTAVNAYNGFSCSGDDRAGDIVTYHGCRSVTATSASFYIYEAVTANLYNCSGDTSIQVQVAGSDVDLTMTNCAFIVTAGGEAFAVDRTLLNSFTADYNRYLGGTDGIIKDIGEGYENTIAGWRTTTGQEAHSDFSAVVSQVGLWVAGVVANDDMPLPLHPDIGAVQNRNLAGRKTAVSGTL